jgi:hypothetical protein
MRRIVVVLGVAAVMATMVALAAGTASAQAETETFHQRGPYTRAVENPCTGEEVLIEGTFHAVIHTTLNDDGTYHAVVRGNINATGTSVLTGDKYRFINTGGAEGYSGVGGQEVNNEEFTYLVVSEGASPNFLMHFVVKVTFNTDGHPNTVVEAGTIRCTP